MDSRVQIGLAVRNASERGIPECGLAARGASPLRS